MISVNLYPIDPDELRAFLLAQDEQAVVGVACEDSRCPLACFLNAYYQGSTFAVSLTDYHRLMDDISLGLCAEEVSPLPAWARAFVYLVDAAAGLCDGVPISASDALRCLQAACALPVEVEQAAREDALC